VIQPLDDPPPPTPTTVSAEPLTADDLGDVFARSTSTTLDGETIAPKLSNEEQLFSGHALTSSSVSKENPGEFAVNTPDGELSLKPLETSSKATTLPTLVNGTVALFANTSPATDTIIRPDALGATAVLHLRSAEAPKSFSWEVGLGAGEQLRQLSDGSVAVVSAPESASESGAEASREPASLEVGEETPESSAEAAEKRAKKKNPKPKRPTNHLRRRPKAQSRQAKSRLASWNPRTPSRNMKRPRAL
jgi:hypothetical protein